jgi:large subunit ribosomal protein L1
VLVFCPEPQWADAKLAGAKYAGSLELVPDILEDKLQFDRCIATVDQVPVIAKLARVLGPKGLMPNAKTGTLTTDVVGAVKAALLNTPFKVEKDTALFRIAIAKPSFSETDLKANLKIVMDYLLSQNRTTDDGKFVESAQLSVDTFSVEISRSEYGQSSGPKYMLALEKLRAQIAARPKLAM